jgi:ABC-type Na+ efflux pump permease subunit
MITLYEIYQRPLWFFGILISVLLWSLIWKGLGLWFSAKSRQKGWFTFLLLFNTLGLLPIIYLIWFKPMSEKKIKVQVINTPVKSETSAETKKIKNAGDVSATVKKAKNKESKGKTEKAKNKSQLASKE